jgi:hypothetical protein
MPAEESLIGGWIVVEENGHELTRDPLSGERFTEATANQEVLASRFAGIEARVVFRQAI